MPTLQGDPDNTSMSLTSPCHSVWSRMSEFSRPGIRWRGTIRRKQGIGTTDAHRCTPIGRGARFYRCESVCIWVPNTFSRPLTRTCHLVARPGQPPFEGSGAGAADALLCAAKQARSNADARKWTRNTRMHLRPAWSFPSKAAKSLPGRPRRCGGPRPIRVFCVHLRASALKPCLLCRAPHPVARLPRSHRRTTTPHT